MAASPAQIAANRRNAQHSTGPKTAEGKDAARRNALKHGLTGGGVVIPGEDEQAVGVRVAALEAQLVPEGDVLGALLVRQVAIASIRVERAFRHETALAAERMRRASDLFDDGRHVVAGQILGEMSLDPATCRRRLLTATEGIDLLLGRLAVLREKATPRTFVAWDDVEGNELDQILGNKPGQGSASRVEMLTRGIAFDHWVGLDPAEFAGLDFEARLLWAVGEVQAIIDAEIGNLTAIRAILDTSRADQGRAEAAERTLLDLSKDGLALRRYAGAAERTMLKALQELRLTRDEARERVSTPAAPAEVLQAMVTEMPARSEVRSELASFGPKPRERTRPGSRGGIESVGADPQASTTSFAVGRGPDRPDLTRS